jgi:hypothetical protein
MDKDFQHLVRSTHNPGDGGLADALIKEDRKSTREKRIGLFLYQIRIVRCALIDGMPVMRKVKLRPWEAAKGLFRYNAGPGYTVFIRRSLL